MTPGALVQAVSMLAEAAFHDKSKTPFYIFGGGLALWAVIVGVSGFTRADFPGSAGRGRIVMGISFVLMVLAMGSAVTTASTPPPAKPFTKPVGPGKGTAPAPTPPASGAVSAAAPVVKTSPGTVNLAANANGQLLFDMNALSVKAKAGKVTIVFTNASPVPHNVAVTGPGGKVLGSTPTFMGGGAKTLVLALKPGTYTYICTVAGHAQAGMKGTLAVT